MTLQSVPIIFVRTIGTYFFPHTLFWLGKNDIRIRLLFEVFRATQNHNALSINVVFLESLLVEKQKNFAKLYVHVNEKMKQ